jgi:hypothetical protein
MKKEPMARLDLVRKSRLLIEVEVFIGKVLRYYLIREKNPTQDL